MACTVVDASRVAPYRGVMRQMRRALGVSAFGIDQAGPHGLAWVVVGVTRHAPHEARGPF